MIECQNTWGEDVFAPGDATEIEAAYQKVKDRFMVTDCKKCGTKRLNHSWSKLNFVSMAKETSLARLVVLGYFLPLRQAHATVGSLLSRMTTSGREGLSFLDEPQRKEADTALRVSHNIILDVLRVQDEHFTVPGLKERNGKSLEDFVYIWHKR
jgi:hypothetical protein